MADARKTKTQDYLELNRRIFSKLACLS